MPQVSTTTVADTSVSANGSALSRPGAERRRSLAERIGTVLYVADTIALMRFGGALVPEHRGLLGYVIDCAMGFIVASFPLLVVKLWATSPGVFMLWLFWSAVLIGAVIAAVLLPGLLSSLPPLERELIALGEQ